MNTIVHTVSVVASSLVLLGCALVVLPTNVFSQGELPNTVDEAELDVISQDEVVDLTSQQDSEITVAISASDPIVDSYKRETLLSDEVFQDFVVGPGRFVLELAPGESKTVEMVISNRMGERKRFSFETEDATGSSDGSQAIVLLGDQRGPYTLRDYIKIPHMQFDLNHAERVRIPVTVSLPKDAEPGGRYGSLVVSIVSDPIDATDESGAKSGSVVVSRIGTLFFVTTPGSVAHEGALQKFSTVGDQSIFAKGPINFAVVTENTGSVHLTPYGEIRVYNAVGSEVGFVELQPWFVMPKSLRVREVSWNRDFMIGRYTATAKINRGYDDVIDEQSYVFWVIPWKIIAVVFVSLFVFFLLLRFIFSQFEFKRKIN
jgi:hypothetical protein